MVRAKNDFDEVVFKILGVKTPRKKRKQKVIFDPNGQQPLQYYDPLKPILNRMRMRPADEHDDYFGETPAFI